MLNDLRLEERNISIQFKDQLKRNYTNYTAVEEINFDELYQHSYDKAFQKVTDFGRIKLGNEKSIAAELVDSSGFSLWYHFRFMIFYEYRKDFNELLINDSLKKLTKKYTKIYVYHSSKLLDGEFRKSKGIKSIYLKKEKKSIKKHTSKNIIVFLAIAFVRFILGLKRIHLLFNSKRRHLFLSSANAQQPILSYTSLELKEGDHLSDYYQSYIANKKETINLSEFYPPKLKSSHQLIFKSSLLRSEYSNTLNFETIFFLQFFNPLFYYRSIRSIKRVFKSFSRIERASFETIEDQLIQSKVQNYKRLSYYIQLRKEAIAPLLKRFKIASVSGTHEHDSKNKSIFEKAQQLGIQTNGIQHGVIHFKHLHYCFSKFDAEFQPFPNNSFLWGKHWKEGLQQFSNYPIESLQVVGQIRTDIIPRLKEKRSSLTIDSIDPNKRTILYPSQPLYVGEEKMRERLALDFLKLTVDFPEIQFVVKPHPKELDCEVYFEQLSKRVSGANFQVVRQDLYKLLALSDTVIIYNSTVGAEAIYFRKPLVVMNYSDNDFSGFVKSGIATGVKNYESLKACIQQSNKAGNSAVEEFIQNRAFKIDGKVSQRIYKKIIE